MRAVDKWVLGVVFCLVLACLIMTPELAAGLVLFLVFTLIGWGLRHWLGRGGL